ncbi:DUF397 domain-containing protein [Streptomyces sp. NPDC007070]|uniref:DUF397 domain-containing protein n=1 Tax=Streptomyces sp. NPDC007070 TaxID=3154312 RepID=UPI0033FE6FF7
MTRNTSPEGASDMVWFKSSYSSDSEIDSCVEVATEPSTIHVRDSKHLGGPQLAFATAAWSGFVTYAAEA